MNQLLLEKILAQGFPTQREEQWKYTNVSPIALRVASLRGEIATKQSSEPLDCRAPREDAGLAMTVEELKDKIISENHIIFLNGYIYSSDFNSLDKNKIKIKLIDSKNLKDSNSTKKNTENLSADIFENLNQYFCQENLSINIKQNLDHPLQILYINTTENWIQPRNQIKIENNIQAIIIEGFISTISSIMNIVTDIEVAANANLTYIKIQQEDPKAYHIGRTKLSILDNAVVKTFTFSLGAQLARSDIQAKLMGEGAHAVLYGLYISKNHMHLDQHTVIEHRAKKTKSEEIYHGILKDQSRAVFNGKVIVHPNASHTVAAQENHNLLLSQEAEIDTKPELEIYCDDIQCSHGATVGQLDENALFYLRARGLDEISAKNILISAISNKILEHIPEENLRKILRDRLYD